MADVDHFQAEQILRKAITEAQKRKYNPSSSMSIDIGKVILGTHLTYRYILVTGLLGKAANNQINPLAIQAGSSLHGAYDARSLCHKVLVEVEREMLEGRIGGSNEPYLNKPARFPELSMKNAVRKGKDRETLQRVMLILSSIDDSDTAYNALKDAIYYVGKRPSRDISKHIVRDEAQFTVSDICGFIEDFIEASIEGETCALVGGVAFDLLNKITKDDLNVKVHPINQSGASSNEISDIDVYRGGMVREKLRKGYQVENLAYTAEVKDKVFSKQDVDHAVNKAVEAGHRTLIFLTGPRANIQGSTQGQLEDNWSDKGINLVFMSVLDFFRMAATLTEPSNEEIMESLNRYAKSARVKDDTISHLMNCARKMGWVV